MANAMPLGVIGPVGVSKIGVKQKKFEAVNLYLIFALMDFFLIVRFASVRLRRSQKFSVIRQLLLSESGQEFNIDRQGRYC